MRLLQPNQPGTASKLMASMSKVVLATSRLPWVKVRVLVWGLRQVAVNTSRHRSSRPPRIHK